MYQSLLLPLLCSALNLSSPKDPSDLGEDYLSLRWSGPEVLGVEVQSVDDLIPGDQVYYWQANLPGVPQQMTFMHFGLYLGQGLVANWRPDTRGALMEGEVYLSTWEKFALIPSQTGGGIFRAGYGVSPLKFMARPGGTARMKESDGALVSVVRGIASMGERFWFDPLFMKNCETVSFFAKTGLWTQSRQVSPVTGPGKIVSMVGSLLWDLIVPADPPKAESEADLTKGGADLWSQLPSLFPAIMEGVGVTIKEDSRLAQVLVTPEKVIGFCRALTFILHFEDTKDPLEGQQRRESQVLLVNFLFMQMEEDSYLSTLLGQLVHSAPPVTDYMDRSVMKEHEEKLRAGFDAVAELVAVQDVKDALHEIQAALDENQLVDPASVPTMERVGSPQGEVDMMRIAAEVPLSASEGGAESGSESVEKFKAGFVIDDGQEPWDHIDLLHDGWNAREFQRFTSDGGVESAEHI